MSESCNLLQKSHWELARNKLELAKQDALSACNAINIILTTSDKSSLKYVSLLAHYSLSYYKNLSQKGAASLLAQEKFCWLTSTPSATGGFWYPVIFFEENSSNNIAPIACSDENIQLPDFGPEKPIQFCSLNPSLLDSINGLSLEEHRIESVKTSKDIPEINSSESLADLYQDILSDCSFVLSLLSLSELGLTQKVRDLVSIFENETAKVRLFVNGCWREVVITTKLPIFEFEKDRSLFVRSATRNSLLWPALIEKAYVTYFDGHYAFGGSNMANDTFMLTGWLPEIRLITQTSQDTISELWNGKVSGNLLIGLGTGTISRALEDSLGIISNHDYVLGDYDKTLDSYTLINPWAFRDERDLKCQRVVRLDGSTFRNFKFLYLNWKPRHKYEVKLFCVSSPSHWPNTFLGDKPQFHLCNRTNETNEIVILVEKFQECKADFNVSVWEGAKHIIYTTDRYHLAAGGKFVNSKHHLIRLEMAPNVDYILSIVSKDEKASKFAITIHHDISELLFLKAKSGYDFTLPLISGNWGQGSSGGNWLYETFINNPQYDFEIEKETPFLVVLGCNKENIDVNVHLIHCSRNEKGTAIRRFDPARLLFNEKYLGQLFIQQVAKLDPGCYKVVVSTYNRGELDGFKLLLAHNGSKASEVIPTPRALGTFIKDSSFEWRTSNRHKLEILTLHKKTEITFHLRLGESDDLQMNNYRPAIRASIFDEFTREPVVITSKWNDSVYGAFLDCCLPELDRSYILLVERFETGEGFCRISTGSSHRIDIREFTE